MHLSRKQAEALMVNAEPEILCGFLTHPNSQVRKRAAHKLGKAGAEALEHFLFYRVGGPADLRAKDRKLTPDDYERIARYAAQFQTVKDASEASGIGVGRIRSALSKVGASIIREAKAA